MGANRTSQNRELLHFLDVGEPLSIHRLKQQERPRFGKLIKHPAAVSLLPIDSVFPGSKLDFLH